MPNPFPSPPPRSIPGSRSAKLILVFASALAAFLIASTASPLVQADPLVVQPHAADIRVAAEWEPVIGVLIGWPLQLPDSLVVELSREVDLYVTVNNSRSTEQARRHLGLIGVDLARVHFMATQQGPGYYLTRDWGPLAVFDERDQYRLVHGRYLEYPLGSAVTKHLFRYTRFVNYQRNKHAPSSLAQSLGCPSRELPVNLTGGNLAFDGQGSAFATQILIDENRAHGISKEVFLALAGAELGIKNFHILPNFELIGIQHIDCLLKLLDEERILIKRVPVNHPAYNIVEGEVRRVSQLTNIYGRPYQILRIDTPRYLMNKLASYTNSLIVNRTIFVPLFGIPADADAVSSWQKAMPGYEVKGFAYEHWLYTDALHCRVRGVWDPHMLYMSHRRMEAEVTWAKTLTLAVKIHDHGHRGLLSDQLHLTWRTQGTSEWRKVPLRPSREIDVFEGTIAGVQPGQSVEYYFSAASMSGRQETLPRTAPKGVFSFKVSMAP